MSRNALRNTPKAKRHSAPVQPPPQPARQPARRGVLIASGVALLLTATAGTILYRTAGTPRSERAAESNRPGLASDHSPTLGDPGAKVHIVEFLDPACETCATFYPLIKKMMADNPNKIRLSIRHVPLHPGSGDVVRFLEASRKQGKYWQTLEALLASQAKWTLSHTAHPDLALQAIAGLGLNREQLLSDMRAPEVAQRMERDRADAVTLKVTQTPEYFVNGRQMQSFGRQQLEALVRDALQSAY